MMESESVYDAIMLFEYLYIRDVNRVTADLIIGFGHFDLKIPRQCAYLYQQGYGPIILFTGGRGSGSADLADSEAKVFSDVLQSEFQKIPCGDVILESGSTNTGDNITMSAKILRESDSGRNFANGIESIIAVASAYRQRRVWRTLQKHLPRIKVYNMPPKTSFEEELLLFREKREDYIQLMLGEIERIISYPEKGFMEREYVPEQIMSSYSRLKQKSNI